MRKRAGQKITADMMNDYSLDAHENGGVSAGANFTFLSFSGRKVDGIATVYIAMTYTGTTITSTSAGNITDTPMCVLPTEWVPPELVNGVFTSNDISKGVASLGTNGTITLITLSNGASIASGYLITASFRWISENE